MEYLTIFYAFASGSLILLSVLSFANILKVNTVANRWLGGFYFCLACTFGQLYLEAMGWSGQLPAVVHLLEWPRWAMLPCFYLATLYFVNPLPKSTAILLHFMPAVFFLVFSLVFILPRLLGFGHPLPPLPPAAGFFIRYFFFAQCLVYWLLSFQKLLVHNRNILEISASTQGIDLSWIRYLLYSVLALTIIWRVGAVYPAVANLSPVIYFAGVLCLGYYSLRQGIIYPQESKQLPALEFLLGKSKNWERLTADQVTVLKDRVLHVITEEKLYLDPLLNLPVLSEKIGINTHELSYVLNNGFHKNFYQFINELRVAEAKQILQSDLARKLDMVGVATHAGFNSKTTFNTTFKRITGQTPTEFLRASDHGRTNG